MRRDAGAIPTRLGGKDEAERSCSWADNTRGSSQEPQFYAGAVGVSYDYTAPLKSHTAFPMILWDTITEAWDTALLGGRRFVALLAMCHSQRA